MSLGAALILAASTALVPAPAMPSGSSRVQGVGAQVASAQARATIVEAVIVRQVSGLEKDRDGPMPQIRRRGRTVQIEFE